MATVSTVIRSCLNCGSEFSPTVSDLNKGYGLYCSHPCSIKYRKDNSFFSSTLVIRPSGTAIQMIFRKVNVQCAECGANWRARGYDKKASELHFCNKTCQFQWRSKNLRGENAPNWKGGVSRERVMLMSRKEYCDWRTAVYERDGYACLKCGHTGRGLNAHHIKTWAKFPESRYDVSNGMTLCTPCHRKEHAAHGLASERS